MGQETDKTSWLQRLPNLLKFILEAPQVLQSLRQARWKETEEDQGLQEMLLLLGFHETQDTLQEVPVQTVGALQKELDGHGVFFWIHDIYLNGVLFLQHESILCTLCLVL